MRQNIPATQLNTVVDNSGVPNGSFNLASGDGLLTDVHDGEILVSLTEDRKLTRYFSRLPKCQLHDPHASAPP